MSDQHTPFDELQREEQWTAREYELAKLRTAEAEAKWLAAKSDELFARVAYERASSAYTYALAQDCAPADSPDRPAADAPSTQESVEAPRVLEASETESEPQSKGEAVRAEEPTRTLMLSDGTVYYIQRGMTVPEWVSNMGYYEARSEAERTGSDSPPTEQDRAELQISISDSEQHAKESEAAFWSKHLVGGV